MHSVDIRERIVAPLEGAKRLDCQKWHKPLVSIIVTHHNYSSYLEDALLSLLDQTHGNWECVVVDDASTRGHRATAETIVSELGCDKIRFLQLHENIGQIPAFFAGVDVTVGEFVCILDPDDRYEQIFLEEMLKAHLNDTVFCPIACCDQRLLKNGVVLSGVNTWLKKPFMSRNNKFDEVLVNATDRLFYFPPDKPGWHWTSTSSMMFRRPALNLVRPYKPLAYKRAIDSYVAQGTHVLGGTLFLTKPLVYRGVHDANGYLTSAIFASTQNMRRPQREHLAPKCREDALDAIAHNGGGTALPISRERRGPLARWRRSIEKRLNILKWRTPS